MNELKSQDLKKALSECVDQMGAAFEAFPWENKYAYGQWLAQTYYFVRHTTSFLGLTASRFGHWQRDRQYRQLNHLREESGHDQLLLDDLSALGLKFEDFAELPETGALYQTQYYFIEHENPASHSGYAQSLEGLAAKKIELIYSRVETSFSSKASNFLRVHMEEDKQHFERGLDIFNELTPTEIESTLRNLRQTTSLYIHMLNHIKQLASKK